MRSTVLFCLAATSFVLSPPSVFSDGGIITQAAVEGALAPCDDGTPGFPCVLDTPGTYRLAGNLTVASTSSAIVIGASHISLDLGGYQITGSGVGPGILMENGVEDISILDGVIRGFSGNGIAGGCSSSRFEDIRTAGNETGISVKGDGNVFLRCRTNGGTGGIGTGDGSLIHTVLLCPSGGTSAGSAAVDTGSFSLVASSVTRNPTGSYRHGIGVASGSIVTGSASFRNGGDALVADDTGILSVLNALSGGTSGSGANAGDDALLLANTATGNGAWGIRAGDAAGAIGNVMDSNTSGDLQRGTGASLGNNICSGTSCH